MMAAPVVAAASGPPVIENLALGGTQAEVGGKINPEGLETTYEIRVECKGEGPIYACEPLSGPRGTGTLAAGSVGQEVSLNVAELTPGAYWIGVLASNAAGKAFERGNAVIPSIPPGAAPEGIGAGELYNPPMPAWIIESAQRAAERAVAEQTEKEARERAAEPATKPSSARCVVPSLIGDTLTGARRLLARARCTLGRVAYARRHGRRLHIVSQRPARGTHLAAGARVSVRIA
jgi:hypothetical protein